MISKARSGYGILMPVLGVCLTGTGMKSAARERRGGKEERE